MIKSVPLSDSVLYLFLALLIAKSSFSLDYECFEKKIKLHLSQCCVRGFIFDNRTLLESCTQRHTITEFEELTGLIGDNDCISECYFNRSAIHRHGLFDPQLTAKVLHWNPYLSQSEIEFCVGEANKLNSTTLVIHNSDVEMLTSFSSCRFNSQLLAVCLEERIFSNCPPNQFLDTLNCVAMREALDSCNQTITADQFHGVEKISISN